MRVKGKNLHIYPDATGWCVVSEANRQIINHFKLEGEALAFAQQCAQQDESEVLVHSSACTIPEALSSVDLPQRQCLPSNQIVGDCQHYAQGSSSFNDLTH